MKKILFFLLYLFFTISVATAQSNDQEKPEKIEAQVAKLLEEKKPIDPEDQGQRAAVVSLHRKGKLDLRQEQNLLAAAQVAQKEPSMGGSLASSIIETQVRRSSLSSVFTVTGIAEAIQSGTIKVELKGDKIFFVDKKGVEHDFSTWKPLQGVLSVTKDGEFVFGHGKRNYVLNAASKVTENEISPQGGPPVKLNTPYDTPATFILRQGKIESLDANVRAIVAEQQIIMDKNDHVRITEANQIEFKVRLMIGVASTFSGSTDENNADERLMQCKGTCTFTITDGKIDLRSHFFVGQRNGLQGEFSGSYGSLKDFRVIARQNTVVACLGCSDFDPQKAKREFGGYVHVSATASAECVGSSCRQTQGVVIAGIAGARVGDFWHIGTNENLVASFYRHGVDGAGLPIYAINTQCANGCAKGDVGYQFADGKLFRIIGDGESIRLKVSGYSSSLSGMTGIDFVPAQPREPAHFIITAGHSAALVSGGATLVGIEALDFSLYRIVRGQQIHRQAVIDSAENPHQLGPLKWMAASVSSMEDKMRYAAAIVNSGKLADWEHSYSEAKLMLLRYAKYLAEAQIAYNEVKTGKPISEALSNDGIKELANEPSFFMRENERRLMSIGSSEPSKIALFGFDEPVPIEDARRLVYERARIDYLEGTNTFKDPLQAAAISQRHLHSLSQGISDDFINDLRKIGSIPSDDAQKILRGEDPSKFCSSICEIPLALRHRFPTDGQQEGYYRLGNYIITNSIKENIGSGVPAAELAQVISDIKMANSFNPDAVASKAMQFIVGESELDFAMLASSAGKLVLANVKFLAVMAAGSKTIGHFRPTTLDDFTDFIYTIPRFEAPLHQSQVDDMVRTILETRKGVANIPLHEPVNGITLYGAVNSYLVRTSDSREELYRIVEQIGESGPMMVRYKEGGKAVQNAPQIIADFEDFFAGKPVGLPKTYGFEEAANRIYAMEKLGGNSGNWGKSSFGSVHAAIGYNYNFEGKEMGISINEYFQKSETLRRELIEQRVRGELLLGGKTRYNTQDYFIILDRDKKIVSFGPSDR